MKETYMNKLLRLPIFKSVFFLTLCLPILACSQMKTIEWREEVQLSNGKIVIVERALDCQNVYGGGSGNGCFFKEARIKGKLRSDTEEIAWKGKVGPLALDIAKDGNIYLVAIVETIQGEAFYNVKDDHVAFRYGNDGKWSQIPIAEVPKELHANLFVNATELFLDEGKPTTQIMNLARKKIESNRSVAPRYKHW
jgi:hypothetical protein